MQNRPECSRVCRWFNSGVKFLQFHLRASRAPSPTYWQRPVSAHLPACRQREASKAHHHIRPPFDGYRRSRRRRLCSPSCHSSSTSVHEWPVTRPSPTHWSWNWRLAESLHWSPALATLSGSLRGLVSAKLWSFLHYRGLVHTCGPIFCFGRRLYCYAFQAGASETHSLNWVPFSLRFL